MLEAAAATPGSNHRRIDSGPIPFAVQRADKDYIFVEELRYETNRGEIAVLEHRAGELLGR